MELRPQPWNWSPDGRSIIGIRSDAARQRELIRIDARSGAVESIARLGTASVSPDPGNNIRTLRSLQISREGKVILAEMDTRSDIYLLEGLRPRPSGWLAAIGERFGR